MVNTMESFLINSETFAKCLAISSFITCLYLPLLLFGVYFQGGLYDIGSIGKSNFLTFLFAAECLKHGFCWYINSKQVKKQELRKFRFNSLLKFGFVMVLVLISFYITAVFFGAPFFSKQSETFVFSFIMTVFTALPCCIYLGPDSAIPLYLSITTFNTDKLQKKFLLLIQLTCFGAWAGSIIIPLDWNKPYQIWPLPNIFGAFIGNFLAHLVLVLSYLFQNRPKRRNYQI